MGSALVGLSVGPGAFLDLKVVGGVVGVWVGAEVVGDCVGSDVYSGVGETVGVTVGGHVMTLQQLVLQLSAMIELAWHKPRTALQSGIDRVRPVRL